MKKKLFFLNKDLNFIKSRLKLIHTDIMTQATDRRFQNYLS